MNLHLRLLLALAILTLSGCASRGYYYDLSVGTTERKGISCSISRDTTKGYSIVGAVGTLRGVTFIANRGILPDSIFFSWRNDREEDHLRWVRIPRPLPERKGDQKYHLWFIVHEADSVEVRVRVLERDDCTHIGSSANIGPGPCAW